jgi:hypothetical protein
VINWGKLGRWHRRMRTVNNVSGTVESVSGTGYLIADTGMALHDFVENVEVGSEWWDLLAGSDEDCGEDSGDYPCADSGSGEEEF